MDAQRPQPARASQPPDAVRRRTPRRHRLPVDPARRPGHRTLRRSIVCAQSRVLRWREYRPAGDRGRLQRRRLDIRRSGLGRAEVRPPDPIHLQDQPQRVPDVPQQVRPDPVRHCARGVGAGRRGAGSHRLFRLGAVEPAAGRDRTGVPRSALAGHGNRALVLPPNPAFTQNGVNYELAADLTAQANHLGVTIEADIIKQKLPETNGGFTALKFGRTSRLVYEELTTDNPIDLTRYQVVNCFMGRSGLINSGGASGNNDLADAVRTAVINKRAGGMGLISGRKAFQKPMADGVKLLNAIQDVYLAKEITVA